LTADDVGMNAYPWGRRVPSRVTVVGRTDAETDAAKSC
jgi:hypothetical protein